MDIDTILLECDDHMQGAFKHTLHEFDGLHTGKATPAMVESLPVVVHAYGDSTMQVRELGAVTTPDAQTIQITVWDRSTAKDVEKAIQTSDMGFNPSIDGPVVRIHVPELSGERRRELVKVAHKVAEDGRIQMRHHRHTAIDGVKKLEKDKEISEDDRHRAEKDVQELTDKYVEEIGKALAAKEKDLLTV